MIKRIPLAATLAVLAVSTSVPAARAESVEGRHTQAGTEYVLANQDDGDSVTAHPGDGISAILTGRPGEHVNWVWSVPMTGDASVLNVVDSGVLPDHRAWVVFHAAHEGSTTIESSETCVADPGYACPTVAIPWKTTVTVE